MFGLLPRPSRRPRKTGRTAARPALRVEALESRSNPSSYAPPVMSNMSATWSDPSNVVVTGMVLDAHPTATVIRVTSGTDGGGTVSTVANPKGQFTISIHTDGTDPIIVQAQDMVTCMYSGAMQYTYGVANPAYSSTDGSPILANVQVTEIGNVWHITGQVLNSTPYMTYLQVSSSIPDIGDESQIDNPNGTFDIGITLTDGVGGDVSVTAVDGATGLSSIVWNVTIG